MLKRLRPMRPSPAMIVAMIALVGMFGGTAIAGQAVDLAKKKLIDGSKIKTRSISGSKLKRNTVSGTEVDESKLAKVPSASNADRATSATNATNATSATNAGHATSADSAGDIPDLSFQDLTLKNGWVGNCFGDGAPGIAKGADGVVHFRGGMCRASGTSFNPFALPAGFVPSQSEFLPVDLCNSHTGRLFINSTDGEVSIGDDPTSGSPEAPCFTSLAGVTYSLPY